MYHRYKDRATFLMVYVREAHPTDGWRMESNDRVGVAHRQPQYVRGAGGRGQRCGKRLALGFPMLVDTIDDRVGAHYSGMPGRFYLIDRRARLPSRAVAVRSGSSRPRWNSRSSCCSSRSRPRRRPPGASVGRPRRPRPRPRPSRRGNRPDEPLRTSHADQVPAYGGFGVCPVIRSTELLGPDPAQVGLMSGASGGGLSLPLLPGYSLR